MPKPPNWPLVTVVGVLTHLALLAFGSPNGVLAAGAQKAAELRETHKAPASRPKHAPNRLARQTSPYLLMHANNPVDWHPWGPEAFAKAKAEEKLIFLSVGYSSCYWCHVMERESFTDLEIAQFLNEHFVAIKVDREERPDVDEIYMTALAIYFRAVGSPQGGGWPLSMFLTPDAKPIAGGTYFPPRDKDGQVGFLTRVRRFDKAWHQNRDELKQSADRLAEIVDRRLRGAADVAEETPLDAKLVDGVFRALEREYDPAYGGFGYSAVNSWLPKFPEPSNLVYLLNRARRERRSKALTNLSKPEPPVETDSLEAGDPSGPSEGDHLSEQGEADAVSEQGDVPERVDGSAEAMLVGTLEKMGEGGIRDHLGGGFHRYSTDRSWHIPHFEKMLYDNAQLASVYSEAHELTGRDDFRQIVEETLDFVLREMAEPAGGFYSALDAETDEEEGGYYVWRREDFTSILTPAEFEVFAAAYGIGDRGNFQEKHVLLLPHPLEVAAEKLEMRARAFREQLTAARRKLMLARQKRERPFTDTKVLTAWNGLMIRGFADAGRVLEEPRYVEAARRAARFVLEELSTPEGRLLRTHGVGRAKLNAYLDDYAFLVDGLIGLYRATDEKEWLDEADRLTAVQIELFWDERGGFFFTSHDHESLIARSKDPADSALPSGNAVSAGNLVYLAGALEKPEYLDRARRTLRVFAPVLASSPSSAPRMAASLAAFLDARP